MADACAAENAYTLAEADWRDGEALDVLVGMHDVQLRRWPEEIVTAARAAAADLMAGFDAMGGLPQRIWQSYAQALSRVRPWSRVSVEAYLGARGDA